MRRFRGIILLAVLVGGCLTTEYASRRRVRPTGRAGTLREYLAWRPTAGRFAAVTVGGGEEHVIAYGPASSWLLMSSGPSAYVFDEKGRLVDWSYDIGDDPTFDGRWSAQRSCGGGRVLSRGDVGRVAATQPGVRGGRALRGGRRFERLLVLNVRT